nr:unnamed protein product [Callosobruchus analis]
MPLVVVTLSKLDKSTNIHELSEEFPDSLGGVTAAKSMVMRSRTALHHLSV